MLERERERLGIDKQEDSWDEVSMKFGMHLCEDETKLKNTIPDFLKWLSVYYYSPTKK